MLHVHCHNSQAPGGRQVVEDPNTGMDLVENEIVPVLYCIMSLVGIIGNGLVIFFILKSKERVRVLILAEWI